MERQRLWVLVSIGVLASCAPDSARVAVERSSEREQHRLAAEVFVQHASAGNVSELLTLMANVTLQANEPGALEAYLRDQVAPFFQGYRSEEHTSELQSRENLVCRLLLEKKKNNT